MSHNPSIEQLEYNLSPLERTYRKGANGTARSLMVTKMGRGWQICASVTCRKADVQMHDGIKR